MKGIVFDAGPIISLGMNNLLWILEELKLRFDGAFLLPGGAKRELVDRPLQTRRFKFEALQVQSLLDKGVFTLVDNSAMRKDARALLNLANRILSAKGHSMRIVQIGEMEAIATALRGGFKTLVIDERVTRTLIEEPEYLHKLMEKKLHTRLKLNKRLLNEFSRKVKDLKIIRSIELVTVAFEKGILDRFITSVPNARRELLESILWGLKLDGASVSESEINELVRMHE
ncbi:hypothetical protein D6825_00800 [Candidatus Woesearchaeota archaeon]|nr:MAG: hypothetical protein D6825_00800 [Candidatus Woesearchaeota archaeon]